MRDHDYWVYILTNKHRTTLYIGMTNSLELRLWQHRWGDTNGFTKRYHLNRLVWFEHFREVTDAIACEKRLKGWRRDRKIVLIEETNPHWLDLSADWEEDPPLIGRGSEAEEMVRDSSLRSE
jgi:putative endonuclease